MQLLFHIGKPSFVIRSLKFRNLPTYLANMTVIFALQNWLQVVQFESEVQISKQPE